MLFSPAIWTQGEKIGEVPLDIYFLPLIFLVLAFVFLGAVLLRDGTTKGPEEGIFPQDLELPPTIDTALPPTADFSIFPQQFVVVDLETTGLDPEGDEIIEVGAIRVTMGTDSEARFQAFIRPDKVVPSFITKLTGITQQMVESMGRASIDVLREFMEFSGDLPLVTFMRLLILVFFSAPQADMGFTSRIGTRVP